MPPPSTTMSTAAPRARYLRWRWRRPAGAVVATAAVLALAGGAAGTGDGDPGGDRERAGARSPLAEILGWGMVDTRPGSTTEISPVAREQHDRFEREVADCMADRGFEYQPVPAEAWLSGPFDGAYALEPDEFARRYGYGVTTLSPPEEPTVENPNREIRDRLPEAERDRYAEAMFGPAAATGGTAEWDEGCQPRAARLVYGTDGSDDAGRERFAPLLEDLAELWRRISNDPRLREAERAWTRCMVDAGHPGFGRPAEAQQSVYQRLEDLRAAGGADGPDPAAVARLRERELRLAVADYACQEEHLHGPRREVAYEWEKRFVAEHRKELEAYREHLDTTSR